MLQAAKRSIRLVGLVVLGAGWVAMSPGCGEPVEEECPAGRIRCLRRCIDPPQANFTHLHENIIEPVCAINRCHGPVDTKEQLEMTDLDDAYDALVNAESVQRDGAIIVVPGSPATSYFMNKITGEDMEARDSMGEETFQMPRAGGLCEEQVDAFEEWIRQGAQR